MPKLPIDDTALPRVAGLGAPDAVDAAAPPAGVTEHLARLRARDDAIDRTRAVSQSTAAGLRTLAAAEADPAGIEPGFADGFVAEIDRNHAETLRAAHADRRPELKAALDATRDDLAGRAAETEAAGRAVRRRLALREALDANVELVGLDGRALDGAARRMVALIDALGLPVDKRDALEAYVRGALANAAVDGLLDDPADAQAALAAGRFDDYLDEHAKAARSEQVAALLERRQVQAAANGLLALSLQAKAGGLDTAALDAAVADGRIGEADAARLRNLDANAREAAAARRAGIQRVAAADGALDPDSPEDQAAVDAYWDTVKDGFASDDPARAREAELFFARWKGVLPSALRKKYEGLLLSGDPALVVSGAEAVAGLEPPLTKGIPPERLNLARTVAGYVDLGLTPGEAVARAREDAAQDEAAPEEVPGVFGDIADPFPAREEAAPGISVDAGASVAVDRELANRVFGTSRGFAAFLRELRQLPAEEAADRARRAGLAGDLARIALDIFDAANLEGDTREAILQAAGRTIDQLPDADARKKLRLNALLADARQILDDPDKLTRLLALNRDLFRGRPRLANVDPNALEARRFADFERQTGLTARVVTETLTPQQGDPDDLTDVVTRDVGPGEAGGTATGGRSRRRIAFFRPGSDAPFVALPVSAANALISHPEKAAERLDFIAKWRSGELAGDDLIAAARGIFIDEQGPSLVLGGGDIANREDFDAFLEAKDRIEAGEDADAVLAALMPSLIPEAYQDPAALADLILDFLPIIGGVRAVYFAMQDIAELRRARAAGDVTAVTNASMSLVFAAAGAIPVVGPLFRNLRPMFHNVLRNRWVALALRKVPGIKRVHASLTFPRRLVKEGDELKIFDDVGRTDAATIFGEAYHKLTPRQQKLARGLISNIKGAAAHDELALLAKNGRLTLNRLRKSRIVKVKKSTGNTETGASKIKDLGDRIFDEFSEEGYELLFNTFLVPSRGRGGTLFEFKAGKAIGSAAQREKTAVIKEIERNGQLIETVASSEQIAAAAEAVRLARVSYKDVPESWLAKQTRRMFEKYVGDDEIGLTKEQVDQLVDAARQWHRQVRREKLENIRLGPVLLVLSMQAQAMARENRILREGSADLDSTGA